MDIASVLRLRQGLQFLLGFKQGSSTFAAYKKNSQVAIVIFDSTALEGAVDAVYLEVEAVELKEPADLAVAMRVLAQRVSVDELRVKHIDQVTNDAVWRIYRATPKVVSKLTDGEYINGQYIDKRIAIDLHS